ncbi:DUF7601 domain-containing protein [Faecalibaculum rodentium]|uniref:DUF7601 domain-containing protein n=1 Tax=Faecalibaculum rodentium TaxID=1702221 RepID=UPI0023F15F13|nr:hypothetical protein [Faecalibaculum rodentium]
MKHYGKLTAAAAAGFMALSAMGVAPVFAAGTDTGFEVNVTKTVSKNDNQALVPAVAFTYSISNGNANGSIKAGINDGLILKNNDSKLESNDDAVGKDSTVFSGVTLVANNSAYTTAGPGVYHYVVTEQDETSNDFDGFAATKKSIEVYVFVEQDSNGENKVAAINASAGSEKSDVDFADNFTSYTLAVTKNVTGNMGDTKRPFDFQGNVTASGTNDRFTGNKGTEAATLIEKSFNTALKHGETYTLHGLSAKDAAAITEQSYTSDGYTTTVKKGDEVVNSAAKTASDNDDLNYTVNNHKQVDTPTGILMSAAPYVGLVGLGGIFAGLFFRRKRED